MLQFIDSHAHLDGEEFKEDLPEVIQRARKAGVAKIFIPGIDLKSVASVLKVCRDYSGYTYPMIGLQPEEVKEDYSDVLRQMKKILDDSFSEGCKSPFIAIGEVGLDFYWSRKYEKEQLAAFEEEVMWAVEYHLPLMIHCRKAQNELLHILEKYKKDLCGGVFHCFTGNQKEAVEYLRFDNFVLGVGGVLTFKSSHLREDLPASVPLERIVLETDSPYMAPVPYRGQRNESAFVVEVLKQLAVCFQVSPVEIARVTNENVQRIFGITV